MSNCHPSLQQLRKIVARPDWWYHTMDLGHGIRTPGHFDFCLCAGLLYHVTVRSIRSWGQKSGQEWRLGTIWECLFFDEPSSTMRLNQGDLYPDHTTIWVPSAPALRGMMRFASFEIIGECFCGSTAESICRHAILCKATKPSELAEKIDDE